MLTLLLYAILVRVVLSLLLEFEALLAPAADLLRPLLLVLQLGHGCALRRTWRGHKRLPVLGGVHYYRRVGRPGDRAASNVLAAFQFLSILCVE